MSDFHEVRFPETIAIGSSGGPCRKTEIVTLRSGFEQRNGVWKNSRHSYDVGYGIRNLSDMHTLLAFFEARMGRLYGFRFKDFADFKSCTVSDAISATDQIIGTGNGSETSFQLCKKYASGSNVWVRPIAKPVNGTVAVAVNGTVIGKGWNVDITTGYVTFDSAPASDAIITSGFEFDVPVRFDTDELAISLKDFNAGSAPNIRILEIRI